MRFQHLIVTIFLAVELTLIRLSAIFSLSTKELHLFLNSPAIYCGPCCLDPIGLSNSHLFIVELAKLHKLGCKRVDLQSHRIQIIWGRILVADAWQSAVRSVQ